MPYYASYMPGQEGTMPTPQLLTTLYQMVSNPEVGARLTEMFAGKDSAASLAGSYRDAMPELTSFPSIDTLKAYPGALLAARGIMKGSDTAEKMLAQRDWQRQLQNALAQAYGQPTPVQPQRGQVPPPVERIQPPLLGGGMNESLEALSGRNTWATDEALPWPLLRGRMGGW
jgi:hypothetical protein